MIRCDWVFVFLLFGNQQQHSSQQKHKLGSHKKKFNSNGKSKYSNRIIMKQLQCVKIGGLLWTQSWGGILFGYTNRNMHTKHWKVVSLWGHLSVGCWEVFCFSLFFLIEKYCAETQHTPRNWWLAHVLSWHHVNASAWIRSTREVKKQTNKQTRSLVQFCSFTP